MGQDPTPLRPPPVIHISGYASGKHYIGPVGWLTVFLSANFEKKIASPVGRLGSGPCLVGCIGSGPYLVGRLWSGVRVSASFQQTGPM